jgi:hypothetical protein
MATARGKLAYVKVTWAFCVPYAPATCGRWLIAPFVSSRLTASKLCSMRMSSHDVPGSRWMCGRVIEESDAGMNLLTGLGWEMPIFILQTALILGLAS